MKESRLGGLRAASVVALVASLLCLMAMAGEADAAIHEQHFCWGATVNQNESCSGLNEGVVHSYITGVYISGVEHSVCVRVIGYSSSGCTGGPGEGKFLDLQPTEYAGYPVIYANSGVQGNTTVYGTIYWEDRPESPPPAVTYFGAFRANTGALWKYGTTGNANLGLPVAPGTSPSVTRLTTGAYLTAYQCESGYLCIATSSGSSTTVGIGMKAGTSPSIAPLPNGNYVVAVQTNIGHLETYSPGAGASDIGIGMAGKTSPAISNLSSSNYVIAVQTNLGHLETFSPGAGAVDVGIGMAGETSPSVTTLTNGNYATAVQTNFGGLETYIPGAGASSLGIGMKPKTSPSIARLSNGSYIIGVQTNINQFETYSPGEGAVAPGYGMAEASSPAMAGY